MVHAKPLKFAVSFLVLFATMALVAARLSPAWREGRLLRAPVAVMGVAFVSEMAWMSFRAARGEASHFNMETPLAVFMDTVVMVAAVGVFGRAAWRDRAAALGPATRAGVALVLRRPGRGPRVSALRLTAAWTTSSRPRPSGPTGGAPADAATGSARRSP